MSREHDALQLCHDALMKFADDAFGTPPWDDLRAALAAAQDALTASPQVQGGEAVAWQVLHPHDGWNNTTAENAAEYKRNGIPVRPLYASPQRAPGVDEVDAYVDNDTGSVHFDFCADPKNQLSLIVKDDGRAYFAALREGKRINGEACGIAFTDAVLDWQAALAPPAPEAE